MKVTMMFMIGTIMLFGALNVQAASADGGQEKTRDYVQNLEKRVADLEKLVNILISAKAQDVAAPPAVPEVADESDDDDDDWGEPAVVKQSAGGRDEDARRRLVEVETWMMKTDARRTKEEKELAQKVRFEFSGKYKVRTNSRDNLHLGNKAQYWTFDDSTFMDQRFQFKADAEYGALSSVMLLDKGNFVFDWKEGSEGTFDRWGEFQSVTPFLVRELYAQYTGDYVLKAGRFNMEVGNGGVIFQGPGDAVKISYPIAIPSVGKVTTNIAYMAIAGGYSNYDDITYPTGDRSAVLGVSNKLDGWLFDVELKKGKKFVFRPYLLKVFDRGEFGDSDLNLDKDFNFDTTPRDGGYEPIWAGAELRSELDNFSMSGDLIFLGGSVTQERDYKGSAVLLRGDYHLNKIGSKRNLSLGVEFGRGSGNSAENSLNDSGDQENFAGLFLCKARRKFGNIFSEDLYSGYFFGESNLANITFGRAILGFVPYDGVTGELALVRMWTTEPVYKGHGPTGDWSRGAIDPTSTTQNVGWEIDLNISFPITKRVKGFFEGGYFVPDDVYMLADGETPDAATELVIGAEFIF